MEKSKKAVGNCRRVSGNEMKAVACALSYEASVMDAPLVTAVAQHELANALKSSARRYGIPIIEHQDLAQQLADVGENNEIPPALYRPVAGVLAKISRNS